MGRTWAILSLSFAVACRCDPPVTPVETGFRIEESELEFGRVKEGDVKERFIHVVSTRNGSLSLTLTTAAPFEVEQELELPGGANVPVKVLFRAGNTRVERVLSVKSPGGGVEVPLKGTGVRPLDCVASAPCRRSEYVLETHSCVESALPEGADCTPTSTCLERGQCRQGLCQGVARSCDDNNKCTVDGCAEGIGCVNAPRICPTPTAPCQVATCDPGQGCGQTQASDFTPCGTLDCVTAQLCVAGSCQSLSTPDGTPCSPPTPCQAMGTCQAQECRRPDAGILQPELVLPLGGLPPRAQPMLLSFAGQLFGQVCGRPLPLLALDGGFAEDGGWLDGGLGDGGFGCELISYTNNGFERFTRPFGDERERTLLHLSNMGAALLDDAGLELRSLGDGRLRVRIPLPGAVRPHGVASARTFEPWLLVDEGAGSTALTRVEDGGLRVMVSLDASVDSVALDELGGAWVSGPMVAGYLSADDAGMLQPPQWTPRAPAATDTLATALGVAVVGNSQFIATAPDAGMILSPVWLDDAGQPLRVQERFSLMSQGRAIVYYRQCPVPMASCMPDREQLRLRTFNAATGALLDDVALSVARFEPQVMEASTLELAGFPPGVATVIQLRSDAGAAAYLQLTSGNLGLTCPFPEGTELAATAMGSGTLWAFLTRDGGAYSLEAYPLAGLPLSSNAWPLADGVAGQRRAR